MEATVSQDRMSGTKMVRFQRTDAAESCSRGLNCVVLAAQTIANVVKSSLGPMGLDKMLVDNIGVRIPSTMSPEAAYNVPCVPVCRK